MSVAPTSVCARDAATLAIPSVPLSLLGLCPSPLSPRSSLLICANSVMAMMQFS